MTTRVRLDAELVRRGLARSREQAAELISAGRVSVGGQPAAKPATQVGKDAAVLVAPAETDAPPEYVSRGGHKLAGALAVFGGLSADGPPSASPASPLMSPAPPSAALAPFTTPTSCAAPAPARLAVAGRRCLDVGASTGGFTDVLLRAGAAHVVAVDVGYGQLAWSLRTDPRVTVLDRVNVRALEPAQVAPPPSLVVGDLSFISLKLVLPALVACCEPDGDYVLMVKPQFEVGKDRVGSGGVVRDPQARADAVRAVAGAAADSGLGVRGVTATRCRDRPATWSTSCGCTGGGRRLTRVTCGTPSPRDLNNGRPGDNKATPAPVVGSRETIRPPRCLD